MTADSLYRVRLARTITVRSIELGKVLIPEIVRDGTDWRQVIGAEVGIQFEGAAQITTSSPDGRLDRLISDLAVNSAQASSWYSKAAVPVRSAIYNPFAQSSDWIRIAIKTGGVYKITRTDLSIAGVNVGAIDPRTVRLFHGGGKSLPTANSAVRDSLAEIAITVFGEDDGVFSGDDFIMFYANGPDFWDWSDTLRYRLNPYGDRNVFYLTYGGSFAGNPKRMPLIDGTATPAVDTVMTFVDPLHFEDEKVLSSYGGVVEDYFHWYWSSDASVNIFLNLPKPLDQAQQAFRVGAKAGTVTVRLHGEVIAPDSADRSVFYFHSDRFDSALNQLDLQLTSSALGTLTDFVEIDYQRALTLPARGELVFFGKAAGSATAYKVAGVNGNPYLLDVTDMRNQKRIGSGLVNSDAVFSAAASQTEGRVFALVNADAMKKPFSIVPTQVDDIRSADNSADLIIIAHDNFYTQALDFAAYRNSHDGIRVRVVRISDVYAQFSGGMVDPVAIRDFLNFAYDHWSGAQTIVLSAGRRWCLRLSQQFRSPRRQLCSSLHCRE